MSTQLEISRIQSARNTIRTKMVELGLGTGTDKIDALATEIEGIENKGAVNATVQEGATYTIPAGYHNGSGTVSGIAGGGNYELQDKTVTPTKKQQKVTPDEGKFGLSSVTVKAIPAEFQNVSAVTATAGDVLANKVIITSDGVTTAGTMPNNGAVTKTLKIGEETYTIPAGYHSGTGTVKIVPETKTVTLTRSEQNITPTAGKVLSKVTVPAIPAKYIDTTDADAVAGEILADKTAYVNGVKVTGEMANNGAMVGTIDGLTTTSYSIPAGYTSGGTVSLTDDIENALAAI